MQAVAADARTLVQKAIADTPPTEARTQMGDHQDLLCDLIEHFLVRC
jgi:hypothetical protein